MAAIGYLPVEFAANDKTGNAEILPPVNHDCQPMNFLPDKILIGRRKSLKPPASSAQRSPLHKR